MTRCSTPHQQSLSLQFPFTWGARKGAGRPRRGKTHVQHRTRERFASRHPLHVTFRVADGVQRLRNRKFMNALRRTLAQCCRRPGFRLIHYSVQNNHVHCIVEANDRQSLANGMKSLCTLKITRRRRHYTSVTPS